MMRAAFSASILTAGLAVGACTVQAPSVAVAPPAAPAVETRTRTVAYHCNGDGNLTARFERQEVRLFLPGRSVRMLSAVSASGARYTGADGEFWDKGGEARLTLDGAQRRCVAQDALDPWSEARLSGVSFRAVGNEPAWLLEVRPARGVTFSQGIPPQVAPWPVEPPTQSGTARVWNLTAPQGTLTVFATPRPCADSMSGERFDYTVTVISPNGTVQGCGRDLD